MRTTTMALLCSLAACAPVGNSGGNYDGPEPDGGISAAGCDEIETLTMNLSIASSAGFANLPTGCWRLDGTLTLSGTSITSLAKLGDLRGVTELELNDTALTTFDTPSTVEVSRDVWIHYNDRLTDLAKLAAKGTVDSIIVEHNSELTNLGGIGKLTVVSGTTTIGDNPKLTVIDLGSVQRLEGGLTVRDNGALTTLDIHSLQSVGALAVVNNAALATIQTSSLLSNIHGTLTIDNNDSLTSLGSLGNAATLDANVIVSGNSRLADVGDLARAARVFGVVSVTSNPALDQTRAHDIGCCVATSGFVSSANKSTSCTSNHWCLGSHECFR